MPVYRRAAVAVAWLLGVAVLPLSVGDDGFRAVSVFVPAAQAQSAIRNMLARLRGERMPPGVIKSNGRIEATQVNVASKYAGRLTEVSVEEGSDVTQGQVVAVITAPEYEAQLRAEQANLQRAKDALASAESEINVRQAPWITPKPTSSEASNSSRPAQSPSRRTNRTGETLKLPPRRSSP